MMKDPHPLRWKFLDLNYDFFFEKVNFENNQQMISFPRIKVELLYKKDYFIMNTIGNYNRDISAL